MTNEQLSVFLSSLADQLEWEIDMLRELLPEDMERYAEWWKGDFRPRGLEAVASDESLKASGFEPKPTGDFVALDGLNALLNTMRDHISVLQGRRAAVYTPSIKAEYHA